MRRALGEPTPPPVPAVLLATPLLTLVGSWWAFRVATLENAVPFTWTVVAAWFLALVVVLPATGPVRPAPVATLVLANALAYAVPGLALGAGVLPVLWSTLVCTLLALLVALGYRSAVTPEGWAPYGIRTVTSFLVLVLVGSALAALAGGFPGQRPFSPGRAGIDWWARDVSWLVLGALNVLVLAAWRRPTAHRPRPPAVLLVVLLTAAVLLGALVEPELPHTWLALVPVITAGAVLGPRLLAGYLLLTWPMLALAIVLTGHVQTQGLVAAPWLDTLRLAFGGGIALMLSVTREERHRLIDERSRQEEAATRQARMFETLFEAMRDGFIVGDPFGDVWLHNRAAERLLGRDFVRDPDSNWAEHFDLRALDGGPATELLAQLLRVSREGPVSFTVRTRPEPDGAGGRVLDVTAVPVQVERGPQVGIFLHDVTAETARMEEMRQFAGTVAHDLRNPLSVVRSMVQLTGTALGAGRVETAVSAVDRAAAGAAAMERVVDGWLAHTVAEAGALQPVRLDLGELLEPLLHGRASAYRGVSVRFEVDAPDPVRGDRLLVRQLISNIVSNAVKYARPGQPPWVRITTRPAHGPWVEVAVADRGVGVPGGDASWLFDAGTRHHVEQDRVQGTGLGLALCRTIVERHGGRIRIAGNSYGGTTVTFTLPAADDPGRAHQGDSSSRDGSSEDRSPAGGSPRGSSSGGPHTNSQS